MSGVPLILTGNLAIGATTGVEDTDEASAVDVSSECIHFKISASVAMVDVPQTMTVPQHGRGGAVDYVVEIGYLSNDIVTSPSSFFNLLWAAVIGSGKLFFVGSMKNAIVSSTNPEWSGEFIVTEATVGAAAQALSQGSATFPMTGAPLQETT